MDDHERMRVDLELRRCCLREGRPHAKLSSSSISACQTRCISIQRDCCRCRGRMMTMTIASVLTGCSLLLLLAALLMGAGAPKVSETEYMEGCRGIPPNERERLEARSSRAIASK